MTRHPTNKFERRLINEKKKSKARRAKFKSKEQEPSDAEDKTEAEDAFCALHKLRGYEEIPLNYS